MMDENRPDRCATCRFWQAGSAASEDGRCKRHAPIAMPSYQAEVVWERHVKLFGGEVDPNNLGSPCHFTYPHVASVAWPNTWDTDWCGEWRGKPDA